MRSLFLLLLLLCVGVVLVVCTPETEHTRPTIIHRPLSSKKERPTLVAPKKSRPTLVIEEVTVQAPKKQEHEQPRPIENKKDDEEVEVVHHQQQPFLRPVLHNAPKKEEEQRPIDAKKTRPTLIIEEETIHAPKKRPIAHKQEQEVVHQNKRPIAHKQEQEVIHQNKRPIAHKQEQEEIHQRPTYPLRGPGVLKRPATHPIAHPTKQQVHRPIQTDNKKNRPVLIKARPTIIVDTKEDQAYQARPTRPIHAEPKKTQERPILVEPKKERPILVEPKKTRPILVEPKKTRPIVVEPKKTQERPIVVEPKKTQERPILVEPKKTEDTSVEQAY